MNWKYFLLWLFVCVTFLVYIYADHIFLKLSAPAPDWKLERSAVIQTSLFTVYQFDVSGVDCYVARDKQSNLAISCLKNR